MFSNFKTIDFYDLIFYPNENRVASKATKISVKELSNLILTSFEPQGPIFNHPEFALWNSLHTGERFGQLLHLE